MKFSGKNAALVIGIVVSLAFIFSSLYQRNNISVTSGNTGQTNGSPKEQAAQTTTSDEICLYSCPTGAPASNKLIKRPIYILSNNGRTKFADWVAYEVSEQAIGPTHKRIWHRDPDLPADETLSPDDYKGAHEALHVDRGHQAPLASLTGTPYWDMADDLSNITPQSTDLNEGPWEKLEDAERNLARHSHMTVHSITGPLYKRPMPRLPHSHLDEITPSGYWKVIAVQDGDTFRTAAFEMDQSLARDADYCSQATTIASVESDTHLRLFPLASQALRQQEKAAKGSLLQELGCQD